MIGQQARYLLVAVQLLTRLPVPRLDGFEAAWTNRAARYFPLVGLLVGAIGALVLLGASALWPPVVAVLLALTVTILLTGALHEDGLADAADGLVGGRTIDQRLGIMKDSRTGTYGVLALLLALALKVAVLASLPPVSAAQALCAMHACARVAPVFVMAATAYVRDPTAAKITPGGDRVTRAETILALATAGLAALMLLPVPVAVVAILAAGVAAAAVTVYAVRRIGGHTGDVLGAVEQVAEVGFLLGCAGALSSLAGSNLALFQAIAG